MFENSKALGLNESLDLAEKSPSLVIASSSFPGFRLNLRPISLHIKSLFRYRQNIYYRTLVLGTERSYRPSGFRYTTSLGFRPFGIPLQTSWTISYPHSRHLRDRPRQFRLARMLRRSRQDRLGLFRWIIRIIGITTSLFSSMNITSLLLFVDILNFLIPDSPF